eukprot:scaffold1120_cov127-Cylindrotheca_fusiformis.AAC.20
MPVFRFVSWIAMISKSNCASSWQRPRNSVLSKSEPMPLALFDQMLNRSSGGCCVDLNGSPTGWFGVLENDCWKSVGPVVADLPGVGLVVWCASVVWCRCVEVMNSVMCCCRFWRGGIWRVCCWVCAGDVRCDGGVPV